MRRILLCAVLVISACGNDHGAGEFPPVVTPDEPPESPAPVPQPDPPVLEPVPNPVPIPEPPAPAPEPVPEPVPVPESPPPAPTCDGVEKPPPEVDADGFAYVGEIVVSDGWKTQHELAMRPVPPPKCWDWVWHDTPIGEP